MMHDGIDGLLVIFVLLGVLRLYLLPTIIALRKQLNNRLIIFAINIFFGSTIIGWIAALCIALFPESKRLYKFTAEVDVTSPMQNLDAEGKAKFITDLVRNREQEIVSAHLRIETLSGSGHFTRNQLVAIALAPILGVGVAVLLSSFASELVTISFAALVSVNILLYPAVYNFADRPEAINKLQQKIVFLTGAVNRYCDLYAKSAGELYFPKIHMLGLVTVGDVIKKIDNPKIIGTPYMIRHLLDFEAARNLLERIELKDGDYLYKSLVNKDKHRNSERIELEID